MLGSPPSSSSSAAAAAGAGSVAASSGANNSNSSSSGPSAGAYLRALTGVAYAPSATTTAGGSSAPIIRGSGAVTCIETDEQAGLTGHGSGAAGGRWSSAGIAAGGSRGTTTAMSSGIGGSYVTMSAGKGGQIISPLGVVQPAAAAISMSELASQPASIQVEEVLRRSTALPFPRLVEFAVSAPDVGTLLDVTQRCARLVRGNWVIKTEIALGLHWSVRLHNVATQAGSGGGGSAAGGGTAIKSDPGFAFASSSGASGVGSHHGGGRGHSIAGQLGLKQGVHQRLMHARDLLLCWLTLGSSPTVDASKFAAVSVACDRRWQGML